jgi:hypothetical protein
MPAVTQTVSVLLSVSLLDMLISIVQITRSENRIETPIFDTVSNRWKRL